MTIYEQLKAAGVPMDHHEAEEIKPLPGEPDADAAYAATREWARIAERDIADAEAAIAKAEPAPGRKIQDSI